MSYSSAFDNGPLSWPNRSRALSQSIDNGPAAYPRGQLAFGNSSVPGLNTPSMAWPAQPYANAPGLVGMTPGGLPRSGGGPDGNGGSSYSL